MEISPYKTFQHNFTESLEKVFDRRFVLKSSIFNLNGLVVGLPYERLTSTFATELTSKPT